MADRAIEMMASEPFNFHGRPLAVFDHFDATPQEAKTLINRGYAVVRNRKYQTADLGPEKTTAPAVAPDVQAEQSKPKRRYRRRDLTAEKS